IVLLAMRSRQYRPRWHPRNHAEPIHYGLLTGRFSILVHDARLGVTSRAARRPAGGVPARYARAARPPRGPGRSPGRPRQRPRGARRAATRDAQNPRVRRVVRVLGRVAPRGRNGGDGQGLGRPARRRGRGPWRPHPLVRRPAGRGAEPRGPRHTERRPPRDRPPTGDAAAGGRRDRPGTYRVVFTTVHGDESEQLRGLEAGALDYLVKPISLRVALEKIRRWVGGGK